MKDAKTTIAGNAILWLAAIAAVAFLGQDDADWMMLVIVLAILASVSMYLVGNALRR
jgi:multisubunit Na+/H+ antiporter MnhG subunit